MGFVVALDELGVAGRLLFNPDIDLGEDKKKHTPNDRESALFSPTHADGLSSACYFGGPWLPCGFAGYLDEYSFGMEYPLQILEMPERRERLVDNILKLQPRQQQGELFAADPRKGLETILDELLALKEKKRPLYKRFSKQVGEKLRDISVPQKPLERFAAEFMIPLIKQMPCHPQSHGGEKGWSPKKSIETHLPIGTLLTFDLKSAFQNMDAQYTFDCYFRHAFRRLRNKRSAQDVAGFLTHVCNVYYKDRQSYALPIGASFSMALFNRIFYHVDVAFQACAEKRHLHYTRWVDDITISAESKRKNDSTLIGALGIVRDDFPVAVDKVFLQRESPFYLLGHKVEADRVTKVDKEELKENRGKPVDQWDYATRHEMEYGIPGCNDDWCDDPCLEGIFNDKDAIAKSADSGEIDDIPF